MNRQRLVWATAALCAALAGCGGGGGGSGATTSASSLAAQGVYEGTTSTGVAFDLLLLEDGTYFSLGGTRTAGGGLLVSDLVQGSGSLSGSSFGSSDLRDFLDNGATLAGTLSASVNPGVSVAGTLSEGSASASFSGAPPLATTYDYNAAPSLAGVAGAWTVGTLQGASATLTVNADGSFSGSSSGCSFSGTITPRPSGKNVFDVGVQFGAAPCVLAGGTASGIALSYPIAGTGLTQLLVAAVDPTRSYGTVLFGQR